MSPTAVPTPAGVAGTPAPATAAVIDWRGVTVRYRGARRAEPPPPALDALTLAVPEGAVLGLVGSNGAGKSTLLRTALGLTLPNAGEVRLLGEDPAAFTDAARACLGYVAQQPELVEWMTVAQHLDYIGGFYRGWDAARVAALRERFALDAGQRVSALSPGDRQKLALLLALGHEPAVLLLDEPVASLDVRMRRAFMRSVFESTRPRTVVVSSHLLTDLERMITHLAVLRRGRLLLHGEWDAIADAVRRVELPAPLPEGTPGLLAQRPSGEGRGVVALIDGRVPGGTAWPAGGSAPQTLNLDDLAMELLS